MELIDHEARDANPDDPIFGEALLSPSDLNPLGAHSSSEFDFLFCDELDGPVEDTKCSEGWSASVFGDGQRPSSEQSMVGAGLMNLGNTCFLNAVMQCFTHTVPLVEGLGCLRHPRCEGAFGYFCVLCNFRDHVRTSLSSSGGVISPSVFFDNLNHFSSSFTRYAQEDAHEFLQCFLDKLERCFLDPKMDSGIGGNLVERVFGGSLVSKLECSECGHCSKSFEPLTDLSLEIEGMENLSDALESFTKVEKIEDLESNLQCEKCKKEVVMAKQLLMDKAPTVAVLHLKRFKADGFGVQKIDNHVEFPLELDFKSYTVSPNADNMELKYDLYGVVVHDGYSPNSGHYYSFIRSSPDTWHNLDDSSVATVSKEYVLSQPAYILFYAKCGTPWVSSLFGVPATDLVPETKALSPKSVLENASRDVSEDAFAATNCVEKAESTVTPLVTGKDRDHKSEIDNVHNVFHPLTPPRPQTPDLTPLESPGSCYRIPRTHVKSEEQVCRKRSVNKPLVNPERKEALRYMSRSMPSARCSKLMAAMSREAGIKKKRKLGTF